MTRDEFIGKLRSIYVGEENAIDEIISEYDRLNNIRKEAIKYIENTNFDSPDNIAAKKVKDGIIGAFILENKIPNDLLNILNKGSDHLSK